MFAGVVDWYRILSIFKASECSVGFPHPTEKDYAKITSCALPDATGFDVYLKRAITGNAACVQ